MLVEQFAADAGENGVERAAAGKGDDGAPAAHGFDGCNAEIFQPRKEEGAAAGEQIAHLLARLAAQEVDVGRGPRLQRREVAPAAHDDQFFLRQAAKGFDRQVDAFVGDETADNEVVVSHHLIALKGEVIQIHRWEDDGAVAAIDRADARLHFAADGDKVVHALCGGQVPLAQLRQQRAQQPARRAADLLALAVDVVLPQEAGGRQAIADVHGAAPVALGAHAVAEAAFVAQDQVVATEVHLLKGQRVEGEVLLVMRGDARQPLHETGADVPGAVAVGHVLRGVDAGIDRRSGEDAGQLLQHILRPTQLVEPVVDESNAVH